MPSPDILELFYCHSGRVGWNMREGTAVYLGAGDLTVHSAACCADSAMMFPLGYAEGIAISIRLASLSDNESAILREVGREREKIQSVFCCGKPVILSSCPDLERIFAPLYAASPARRSLYLPLKIQELLLFLLDFQPEQNALTQYCSQQMEQIKRVHQQLTEHLDQRFTIEALSKQYLMNTATLKKVFKAVYGLPIATYMKEYRIRQAMKLLRETDAPIAEIASQVGYGTQGSFPKHSRTLRRCCPRPIGKRTFPPTGLPRPGPRDWLMGQQGPVSERRGQEAGHRPRFLLPPFFPGWFSRPMIPLPARPAVFCIAKGCFSRNSPSELLTSGMGQGIIPLPGFRAEPQIAYAAAFLASVASA